MTALPATHSGRVACASLLETPNSGVGRGRGLLFRGSADVVLP